MAQQIQDFFFPDKFLKFLKQEIPFTGGVLDNWSFIHFLSGFVVGKITKSKLLALSSFIALEIYERNLMAKKIITKETPINSFSDVVVAFLGFKLAN